MKILITNDDGIESAGLKLLYDALRDIATLTIVAPAYEQSGVGASITFDNPLKTQSVNFDQAKAWKVDGTPADCVKLALSTLLDSPPDLIVSGINHGSNAGRNILYSGTVGAVIESVVKGVPGIAFSFISETNTYSVKKYIPKIIEYTLKHPLPAGSLLNVNFPDVAECEIKGCKMARQGQEYWIVSHQKEINLDGHEQYAMDWKRSSFDEYEESDTALLSQGYITAVPIHVSELTDHTHFKEKKALFNAFFT